MRIVRRNIKLVLRIIYPDKRKFNRLNTLDIAELKSVLVMAGWMNKYFNATKDQMVFRCHMEPYLLRTCKEEDKYDKEVLLRILKKHIHGWVRWDEL